MIGMLVFGDHPYNAIRMVRKGFGIQLNVDFTPDMLHSAIQELLRNSSYKKKHFESFGDIQKQTNATGKESSVVD